MTQCSNDPDAPTLPLSWWERDGVRGNLGQLFFGYCLIIGSWILVLY